MKVSHLTPHFGATVEDIWVDQMSDEQTRDLCALLYDRKFIAIKRQAIDRRSYQAFAERFGSLEPFKLKNYHDPDFPNILILNNLSRAGSGAAVGARKLGNMWHSDSSYLASPLPLTFLHAQRVPEDAGDTLFVDMELALAELPADLRAKIEGRSADHDVRWTYKVKEADLGESISEILARIGREHSAATHPTIATHPVTGKESLYVSPGYTVRVQGYTDDQSQELLREIFSLVLRSERVFSYKWDVNDILIWDNRQVIHSATELPEDADRLMYRIGVTDRGFFRDAA